MENVQKAIEGITRSIEKYTGKTLPREDGKKKRTTCPSSEEFKEAAMKLVKSDNF